MLHESGNALFLAYALHPLIRRTSNKTLRFLLGTSHEVKPDPPPEPAWHSTHYRPLTGSWPPTFLRPFNFSIVFSLIYSLFLTHVLMFSTAKTSTVKSFHALDKMWSISCDGKKSHCVEYSPIPHPEGAWAPAEKDTLPAVYYLNMNSLEIILVRDERNLFHLFPL